MEIKLGAITLGCDKNRVDTEKILKRAEEAGVTLVENVEDADVVVVNTCAFIESAKRESIDVILETAGLKKSNLKKLIVTGCFSKRYKDVMSEEFPEVDAVLGIDAPDKIVDVLKEFFDLSGNVCYDEKRVLTTPPHYAYLKISDGCDNHCTYCAIPYIRGRLHSTPMESLIKEAQLLYEDGVKELIIVAQDTTVYGKDIYGKPCLTELLRKICEIPFHTVRLLYAYPEGISDELINFIAENEKMAKYLDVPLQHISDRVLKRMARRTDEEQIRTLLSKLKNAGITVRSSFIVGFPGETDADFEKLKEFIAEGMVDYAGFFEYSKEENTPAYRMDGHLPKVVKRKRRIEVEKIESRVVEKNHSEYLGKTVELVFEGIDERKGRFYARLKEQCPSVDPYVYVRADFPIEEGQYYIAKIVKSGFYMEAVIEGEADNE